MNDSNKIDSNDYRVDLSVFHGPLDLLLYLIRKDEIDINDIPIARITRQYLEYLEMMQTFNLEVAGEFILMAATLIRIKTRLLLPRDENDPDEMDPREELIMALVEYRKYKEAGDILKEKALMEERNYVPPPPIKQSDIATEWVPSTSFFDLLSAFRDVVQARKDETKHEVDLEEVSVEDRVAFILQHLKHRESATFPELFADLPRRMIAVVTFIALLELARSRRVSISQSVPFAELRIYRGAHYEDSPTTFERETNLQQVVK
ncbi:MAG: segregation/condensation protein A [candidate division Zixibacteria bacterium]|nr:segregation/condensation protein A [candidate division Zixibacteria bacterium]